METEQTGRFRAVGDDGREFVILEYTSYQEQEGDGTCRTPVALTYQTEECIPVNRVREDLFEVMADSGPVQARAQAET